MKTMPIPTKEKCDLNKDCPQFSHFICAGYIHIRTPRGILSLQGQSLDDLNAHRVSLEAEIERLRRRLENVNRVLFGESVADPRALYKRNLKRELSLPGCRFTLSDARAFTVAGVLRRCGPCITVQQRNLSGAALTSMWRTGRAFLNQA